MILAVSEDPVVTDSLKHWRGKQTFATELGSSDLRTFSRELRERSVFSARTTNAEYLDEVSRVVDEMLSGRLGLSAGRLELMRKLKQLGYDPAVGFPQDMADVPPAERGSLQDLSSRQRLDLMLKTLVAQARNYGRVLGGNTETARFAFPAWELKRLELRHTPRGTPESHSVGWQRRWDAAGGSVNWQGATPSVMIALKDSPIWLALGNGAGGDWEDTLGNPYPPFAFNSGMDWRAVTRAECKALGLIEADEKPAPMQAKLSPLQAELQRVLRGLGPDFKKELVRELQAEGMAA